MDALRKGFIWQCNSASWLTEKDKKESIMSVSWRIIVKYMYMLPKKASSLTSMGANMVN